MRISHSLFSELTIKSLKIVKASIYWLNTDGKIVYVNEYACTMHGFTEEELLKKAVWDIDSTVEPENWNRLRQAVIDSPQEFEAVHINKNNRQYPVHISSTYHKIENEEVIICYVHDLSEVKKTKDRLYLSEKIVSSSEELMSYIDRNYIYQEINDSYCKTFNRTKEQIIGKSIGDLIGEELFMKQVKPYFDKVLLGESTEYKTWIMIDDERRYIRVKFFPCKLKKTDLVEGVVANISDITEQKKQEMVILQQSKMMAITELIKNIAHQWRQPLSIISTIATGSVFKKVLGDLTDDEFEKNMEKINDNTQYLSQTIESFNKIIDENRVLKEFSLSEEIEEFSSIVNIYVNDYNIKVIKNLDNSIVLNNYPNDIIQVLINILNNSVDALVNKSVDERFFFITTKKIQDKTFIVLKDNAGGIDESIINKVFEPYTTTKHQSVGMGLGLNTAYNFVVHSLNGNIIAQNITYTYSKKSYTGAEFTITL